MYQPFSAHTQIKGQMTRHIPVAPNRLFPIFSSRIPHALVTVLALAYCPKESVFAQQTLCQIKYLEMTSWFTVQKMLSSICNYEIKCFEYLVLLFGFKCI